MVSENAYKSWDNNPILTTVSTTAYPIHSLEYPAITICGQGMATDTLDKVLKERFESWMRAKNLDLNRETIIISHYFTILFLIVLSQEEVDAYKKQYEKESFPGLEVSMEDVTSMMTAPNPGAAVGAKAISEVGNIFLDSAQNPKFHILF